MATLIPKEDIFDGLPIRWAFHCYMTPVEEHRWDFKKWRRYLLSLDFHRGYELIPNIFSSPRFGQDVRLFLRVNNATTLIGFIKFYQRCLKEYEQILST